MEGYKHIINYLRERNKDKRQRREREIYRPRYSQYPKSCKQSELATEFNKLDTDEEWTHK